MQPRSSLKLYRYSCSKAPPESEGLAKHPLKETWRKQMVKEFITQTNTDVTFDLISAPNSVSPDKLALLVDCMQISQKKRTQPSPGIHFVLDKTISKPRPKTKTQAKFQ
ncbi:hypothetical protein DSO57_1012069 [Entomophthora muscae]|uniref:Uncharacterized protein n=1 Tax=Entomophthora muscae TaxID=34485 RepID=A0ACC2RX08_9FUNG|nr:hypothetical protein DSO57_1012069 [Entomophthora muscae]